MDNLTKQAYDPGHIIKNKGTAFTTQVIQEMIYKRIINVSNATIKDARTVEKTEPSHQKLKQILQ